ncbi:hypothetical protein STEG23_024273 [Scotinomys teguina]
MMRAKRRDKVTRESLEPLSHIQALLAVLTGICSECQKSKLRFEEGKGCAPECLTGKEQSHTWNKLRRGNGTLIVLTLHSRTLFPITLQLIMGRICPMTQGPSKTPPRSEDTFPSVDGDREDDKELPE